MKFRRSGRRGRVWRRAFTGGGGRVSSKPDSLHRRLSLECFESRRLLASAPLPIMPPANYEQTGVYPAGWLIPSPIIRPSEATTDTDDGFTRRRGITRTKSTPSFTDIRASAPA